MSDIQTFIEYSKKLLPMQEQLNIRTKGEDWCMQRLNFPKAIFMETAELQEHLGWKWWKAHEPNVPQAFMEVVDIYHFWLAILLHMHETDIESVLKGINLEDSFFVQASLPFYIDCLAEKAAFLAKVVDRGAPLDYSIFKQRLSTIGWLIDFLVKDLGYTVHDLRNWYVGKNVLNRFRQDNGYKEKTYVKVWCGKEDNEHLADIIESAPEGRALPEDYVYSNLETRYNLLKGK